MVPQVVCRWSFQTLMDSAMRVEKVDMLVRVVAICSLPR